MWWRATAASRHHEDMKLLGRYLALAFLSAVTAEFLLGDQWLGGSVPSASTQIGELLLYAAFYGSAAILIREVARRGGRGWPTILLLALAFGVLEEGIVDQSLFNPSFAGEHLLRFGFIPALGIGGPWTIFVLSLHVIWSIGAPIAIAEGLFPNPLPGRIAREPQTQAGWLRVPVIVVAGILFLVGAFAIFTFTASSEHFMASMAQLTVSAVVAIAIVVVALLLPKRAPRGCRPFVPAALVGLVLTSAYQVLDRFGEGLGPWLEVILAVAILAVGAVISATLRLDVLGLAVGATLTYCWLGMTKAVPLGLAATIEQSALVALVVVAMGFAFARHRQALR